MTANKAIVGFAVAAVLSFGMVPKAEAGTITVLGVKPGSTVTISFDPGFHITGVGTILSLAGKADKNGTFAIVIGPQSDENNYKGKITPTFTTASNDLPQQTELSLSSNGPALGELEPFEFPTFSSDVSLVASIDVDTLLSSGETFTLGETLDVLGGLISPTSSVFFTEAGVPFTGTVSVSSLSQLAPVPEPGSASLLILGLCAGASKVTRSRKQARRLA